MAAESGADVDLIVEHVDRARPKSADGDGDSGR